MSRARDTANQINRVNSSAADATAITVDSSENVGIGTATPSGKLELYGSGISDLPLVINHAWGSSSTALISASAASSEVFKVERNGDLTLSGGVYLGGTAAANKLEDYEEGTFTPLAKGTSTNPSSAPTLIGRYTKIGNQVNIYIKFDAVSFAGASGGVYFDGLPFSASGATVHGIGSVMQYNVCTFNDSPCLYVSGSAAYIYHNVSGGTWDNSQHTGSSAVYMNACATYTTNS